MINRQKHIVRQSVATSLLLLFAAFYVNVNFFMHKHIINGVTIVHSHFHNKHHHDTDAGGHTVSEITLMATISSQFLTTGENTDTKLPVWDKLLLTLGSVQETEVESIHLSCPSLRAPPAILG